MQSFCGEAYSAVYFKKKLHEHYGDEIEITERLGEEDLYSFTNILWRIVQRFHSQQSSSDIEQEKIRIITTAAKLIYNDIKKLKTNKLFYDIFSNLSSYEETLGFVPVSLQIFLTTIIKSEKNQKTIPSIAQSIMQQASPRNLQCPLQVLYN